MKREIDIILDNLEELQALVQAMSQEKEIPSILFRFSYDKTNKIVSLLKDLEEAQRTREEEEESDCKSAPAEVIPVTPAPEQIPVDLVIKKEEEPVVGEEAVVTAVDLGREDELIVAEEILPEPIQQMDIVPAAEPEIVSDVFARVSDPYLAFESKTTLNERIQKQLSTDFRKALSLNDRFRFIRELFNNDSVKMDECIERINHSTDFIAIEQELLNTYKWNKEQEEVAEFFSLIRQRFV